MHFSVGSKVIRNNCTKEGEPGDETRQEYPDCIFPPTNINVHAHMEKSGSSMDTLSDVRICTTP